MACALGAWPSTAECIYGLVEGCTQAARNRHLVNLPVLSAAVTAAVTPAESAAVFRTDAAAARDAVQRASATALAT